MSQAVVALTSVGGFEGESIASVIAPPVHHASNSGKLRCARNDLKAKKDRLQSDHRDNVCEVLRTKKSNFSRVRREQVRLEERTRIAQELHDTLLQGFLSASMQLGFVLTNVPADSPNKSQLDRILQIMRQGIEEGRNTIRNLRSSDDRASDLVFALSGIQQELGVSPDVDFRVVVTGRQQPLQTAAAHEIYRIAKEGLVNAFRHSGAKRIEFELEYTDSDLCMRIRDNGSGIGPQILRAGREGHWGLAGMRERATKIGALLKISSGSTDGTEIQISVPGRIAFQFSRSAQKPSRAE